MVASKNSGKNSGKNNGLNNGKNTVDLERLVAEITADARGEDEQYWAFHRALVAGSNLPCDAFVLGEPVSVTAFDYDGNQRRGIVARCRRVDGSASGPEHGAEHMIAASEVTFAPHSQGGRILAAYHAWLGLDPSPEDVSSPAPRKRQHKASETDLDLSRTVTLIVLSIKERAARCRLPGTDRVITLRASGLWKLVPGEIAVVNPGKQWSYAGHPYLSGEIESAKLDVEALELIPLALTDEGEWDPSDQYWGEEDEPVNAWAKPIIAHGPRRAYEMEQVLPGMDPKNFGPDLIGESNDLKEAGDEAGARALLMELCQADLRCLDAHAHLGNLAFGSRPRDAIRHYEVGLRIGELSLPPSFEGLLPWSRIDNRPFLRCMHGYGLCLWRLDRHKEAERIFERMLWLNPTDNQGARFLIGDLRAGMTWESGNAADRRRMGATR